MRSTAIALFLLILFLGFGSPSLAWTRGYKYLFAFGKAGSDDPRPMHSLMEDSVDGIARAYGSIDGTRFYVKKETRDWVVNRTWVLKELDRYAARLRSDDTFAYAVERAVKHRSGRTTVHRMDGADGYSRMRSAWDGSRRFSGKVSMGELRDYILDVTDWAHDHAAYYAHSPIKHPQATGSYRGTSVFAEPGR